MNLKKRVSVTAVILCLVLGISACSREKKPAGFTGTEREVPEYQYNLNAVSPSAYRNVRGLNLEPGTYISIIGNDDSSAYWEMVKKGIMQAAEDLNKELDYKGNKKIKVLYNAPHDAGDIDEQVNILDEELARYPDVVGIASIDEEAYTVQFDLAAENGIPVIALDSGNNYRGIQCTVKTDNADAARTGAYKLADEIGGSGEILLIVHNSRTETAKERQESFMEKLEQDYPDVQVVRTIFCDRLEEEKELLAELWNAGLKENEREMTAQDISDEEVIQYFLEKWPNIKGVFGTNVTATQLALTVLKKMNKADEVVLMGFDAGEEQIEALERGEISGLVVQNPFGIGYASVVAAARTILETGNESVVNTGYIWVTQENLETESIQKMLYR